MAMANRLAEPRDEDPWQEWMRYFIGHHKWIETQGETGITWIELLVLFEVATGKQVRVKGRMEEELTVDMLTRAYKKKFLEEVRKHVPQDQRELFEAPLKASARLHQVGIRTVAGGIRARPVLDQSTEAAVNTAILRYRGIMKHGDIDRALSGNLISAIRHVKGCARPLWRGHVEADSARIQARTGNIQWKIRCVECDALNRLEHRPGDQERLAKLLCCETCQRPARRAGDHRCASCDDFMMQCVCTPIRGVQPPELSARGLRLVRALRAARAGAGRSAAAG